MPSRISPAAVLMVIGSCVSLQFGAAFATMLFPAAGSWGTTLVRLVLAALVLFVAVRPNLRGWTRASWRATILYGLALGGMNGFFYAAIERLPLGTAVAIEFLGPLVLAACLSRRKSDLIWVGTALAGMAVLAIDGTVGAAALDPLGVVFALIAAAFWAAYILAGARLGSTVPGSGALPIGLAVGALVVLPFGVGGAVHVIADPLLLLIGFATAILASVIPYTLELAALRRLPSNVFGILLSLEPVFAAAAGFVLIGQQVTPLGWVTIGLVVLASAGITLTARPKAVEQVAPVTHGTPTEPIAVVR